MTTPYVSAGLGVAGLVVGLVLDQAIARLPAGRGIFRIPVCGGCGRLLRPRDMVPVLGYVFSGGRCPYCPALLPWRTPVVELLAGLLFAYVGWRWGLSAMGWVALVYVSLLLLIGFIDLERQLVLNAVVYPAAVVALALAPWGPPGQVESRVWMAYVTSLEGGALALVVLLVIYLLSRGGIGEGDVKLGAFLGLALGLHGAFVVLPLSFVVGGLIAIVLWASRRVRRGEVIPFGPAMAAAGIVVVFWGEPLLDWYRGLFGL